MVGGYGDSHFAFVYIGLWEFGVVYTGAVWTTGVECSHGHCVQWMLISGHCPIITSLYIVSMCGTYCFKSLLYLVLLLSASVHSLCGCSYISLYIPTQSWYHHGHPHVCGSGSHYPSFPALMASICGYCRHSDRVHRVRHIRVPWEDTGKKAQEKPVSQERY